MPPDLAADASYAVVVLYYRLGDEVADTIAAVRAQSHPPRVVYLVDNASGDGVLDALETAGRLDGVRVLRLPENLGYAGGMNAGAEAARADGVELLLFVTHELLMDPHCAEELVAAAAALGAAAAGPSLRLPDGSVWANGGRLDWRGGARHHRDDVLEPREVAWLDGACLLVRSDVFVAVGGFDESYFLYWEDVDFSLSVAAHGPVVQVPAAIATQAPSDGSGPAYYVTRNRLWLWRRHRRPLLLLLSVPELLAWGVKRSLTHDRRDVLAVLSGCRDGLLRRPPRPGSGPARARR